MAACGIDSGFHTQQVYDFCRKRESRRIWAIIGRAGAGLPLILPAFIAGLIFSFARHMTSLSAIVFLSSAKWPILTAQIMVSVRIHAQPSTVRKKPRTITAPSRSWPMKVMYSPFVIGRVASEKAGTSA